MTEKFQNNTDGYMDGITIPDVSKVEIERHDDRHKPSIFDIEGALKIIEDEEDGNFVDGDDEPTLQ